MAYKTITLNEEKQQQLAAIIAELDDMAKSNDCDEESSHSRADKLLCEALTILGRADIAQAWEAARRNVGFWYA